MVCPNEGCGIDKNILFDPGEFMMVWDSSLKKLIPKLKGKPYYCPECGEELEFIEVETNIPSFSVSTFKSLPDSEKKRVLRQRFDNDMNRGGKDQKEEYKQQAMKKLIGYDKH